jgi:hypothetical protein
LDVNGTINAKTGVYSNGTLLTSDRRIKEFIEDADLNICYSNVKALPLRRYQYISSFASTKNDWAQIGFIADELSSIFPKSVFEFDNHVDPNFSSLLYINSDQIFMSHYGATQQLMLVVEQQSTQIATLLEQNSTLTHLYDYIPPLVVEQQSTQIATLLEQNSTLTQICSNIPQLISTQIAPLLEQNSTLTQMCSYIPQLMDTVSTLQG